MTKLKLIIGISFAANSVYILTLQYFFVYMTKTANLSDVTCWWVNENRKFITKIENSRSCQTLQITALAWPQICCLRCFACGGEGIILSSIKQWGYSNNITKHILILWRSVTMVDSVCCILTTVWGRPTTDIHDITGVGSTPIFIWLVVIILTNLLFYFIFELVVTILA
jgi:hypothetical protein